MSCDGGHLGFPISKKNRNLVKDISMILSLPVYDYKAEENKRVIKRHSRRRTDNTKTKKGQAIIYKTLRRKLKIEHCHG
jgi:hypothetical protein